jgi:trans-2,3-dihydro-3-hydroxyanthranilate isomerase
MKRRFYQLDVFTQTPLAGNPLAVFTDGDGLSPRIMQAIAREMNLPETVFVQKPTGDRALARLRIFTTLQELPLAGHPVIGAWFLLAQLGVVPAQEGSVRIWQQTGAGILPVEIGFHDGRPVRITMTQKPAEFRAARINRGALAQALGLGARDLGSSPVSSRSRSRNGTPGTKRRRDRSGEHDHDLPVEFVSTGIPNLLVPIRNRALLGRIDVDPRALRRAMGNAGTMAYCFALDAQNCVYARGMLPWQVGEDPATGSAAGSLGAYLARHERLNLATPLEIHQGIEMGRPSRIQVEIVSERGKFVPRVSGSAVTIMEGFLDV